MFRRFVGASLLAVWFVFSGIVFSESVGVLQDPPDANGSVILFSQEYFAMLSHSVWNNELPNPVRKKCIFRLPT